MRPSELKASVGGPLFHLEDLGEILKMDFLFLAFWQMAAFTLKDISKPPYVLFPRSFFTPLHLLRAL